MGIEIVKSFTVNAPAATVWAFLTDPARVARCLPGASITGELPEGGYGGTITVKVGPVTASYKGKMRFERLDEAAGEAEIAASGQETRGKGGADMRMKSRVTGHPDGSTEVTVTSDVNVVGVLAQFGRGMIQDVSDQLFQRFTSAMRKELETPAAAPAAAPEPSAAASTRGEGPGTPSPEARSGGTPGPERSEPPTPADSERLPPRAPQAPQGEAPGADVLDVGALGAAAARRAAIRTLSRPGFWIAVVVLAVLLWWSFHR